MTDSKDVKEMVTELYDSLIKIPKPESKPKRISMRQYFIMCYVKEGICKEMSAFDVARASIDDVANLAAQITYKRLANEQNQSIETSYELISDLDLEHLTSL